MRHLKLMARAQEEFSPHGLRSFFRLLDEDGSKELSPAEVQKGLLILGFEVSRRKAQACASDSEGESRKTA